MWYTILIMLAVDFGGLLFIYLLLRDRVRRATSVESRMAEVRDEVSRLLVELNQATDRNIALMEDKITVLNEAISTADKKIGLLRRETEKHDVGSQIYSRLAEGRSRRAEPAGFTDAESAGYRDAESAGPPVEPAMAVRSAAEPPGQPEAATLSVELSARGQSAARRVAESPGAQPPDVRQRVMMLYRAGFSPSLIASRVGAPMGEVELIISLEQRKGLA